MKNILSLAIVVFLFASCQTEFRFDQSLLESENTVFHFESDSTYSIIDKNYVGGITSNYLVTDSTLYLNYNTELEKEYIFRMKDDSLLLLGSQDTINLIIREVTEQAIFEFDRAHGIAKRNAIPPMFFKYDDMPALDRESIVKAYKIIWDKTRSNFKYPESVEPRSVTIGDRLPDNQYEKEWNDSSIFDDYLIWVRVSAENALRQRKNETVSLHLNIDNGTMTSADYLLDVIGDWRRYDTGDYNESEVAQMHNILKDRYFIDINKDVKSFTIREDYLSKGNFILVINLLDDRNYVRNYGRIYSNVEFDILDSNGKISLKKHSIY